MTDSLSIGATGERHIVVAEEHTAVQWGSGALRVLSTPYMIALMEGAAVDAVDPHLPKGRQTVGIHLDVQHLAATPVGGRVTARAELTAIEGRKLTFRVQAYDEVGLIGEGTHQRFVIDVERFMTKAEARRSG